MFDIHSHILPFVDDGADDISESLQMAKIAYENGITAMVATPHFNIPGMFGGHDRGEYIERCREIKNELQKAGIPISILLGMEVFATPEIIDLYRENKLLTINNSRYLLVEFAFDEDLRFVSDILSQIKNIGIVPVIAHAERYDFVMKDPGLAYKWHLEGSLIQMNKGSLQGRFGHGIQKLAHRLLRHGTVSVIASDAHSSTQRTPRMKEVYKLLLTDYPKEYIDVLFNENPKRICKNQPTYRFKATPFDY